MLLKISFQVFKKTKKLNSGFWMVFSGMEGKHLKYLKCKHDIAIFNLHN